jgi:hypothetical protein
MLKFFFIFPDAIRFTTTSIMSLIIESKFVDLLSINNKEKSLSKESVYHSYKAPGGGWNSGGIEL